MENKKITANLSSQSINKDDEKGFYLNESGIGIYRVSKDESGNIIHEVLNTDNLVFRKDGEDDVDIFNLPFASGNEIIDWTISQATPIHVDNYSSSGSGGGGGGSFDSLSETTNLLTCDRSFAVDNYDQYVTLGINRRVNNKSWQNRLQVGNPDGTLIFQNYNATDDIANNFSVGGVNEIAQFNFGGTVTDILHTGNLDVGQYLKMNSSSGSASTDEASLSVGEADNKIHIQSLAGKHLHLNPLGNTVHISNGAGNTGTTFNNGKITTDGGLNLTNLPTSATGLVTGDVWNDGGILKIVL